MAERAFVYYPRITVKDYREIARKGDEKMQEEIVIEEPETIEVELEGEEEAEPEPEKVFDLTKIQSDYELMQKEDPTKMTRMRYEKYLWLESKLVDAGILGLQAWEKEYELS